MPMAQRKERVDELFRTAFPENAEEMLATAAVVELVRLGTVSVGKAAEVLEMNREDFDQILADHGVPTLDVTSAEVRREADDWLKERGT